METFDIDWHDQDEPVDFDPGQEDSMVEQMERREPRLKLDEWLESLPPRKARIIRYRLGLDGGRPHTLEATASEFGTTRERIRQIEASTIGAHIHNRAHAALNAHRRLSDFMED